MPPPRRCPYGVAPWARRRSMTSCVASESTPRSRPPGPTRNGSITPANTISWTCRFRSRCSEHQAQGLTLARTGMISCGHTRWTSKQARDNGPPRGGDRERPCPREPTADTPRHTLPAALQRHAQPATISQPRAQRQVVTVLTGDREVDRDRYSAPNLDPRRRQELSSRGSMSIMTPVTRPPKKDDAARVHRADKPSASEPSWTCPLGSVAHGVDTDASVVVLRP